jgi:hypothetical protein
MHSAQSYPATLSGRTNSAWLKPMLSLCTRKGRCRRVRCGTATRRDAGGARAPVAQQRPAWATRPNRLRSSRAQVEARGSAQARGPGTTRKRREHART